MFIGFFTCRCLLKFRVSSNAVLHTHTHTHTRTHTHTHTHHIGVGLYEVKIVLVLKSYTVKTCFSIGGTCPISDTSRGALSLECDSFNLQII